MAYLYRPKSVKWQLGGKIVSRGTPGAKRKVYTSGYWWGAYRDWQGVEQRVKLSERKDEAQRLLAALITQDDRRRLGQSDPVAEQASRPIMEHIADYQQYLASKGNTADHTRRVITRVKTIMEGIGARRIGDISESEVMAFLADLREADTLPEIPGKQKVFTKRELCLYTGICFKGVAAMLRRHDLAGQGAGKARLYPRAVVLALREAHDRGRGTGTVNHYLSSVRAFTRWLWRNHRLERDPLLAVSRFNPALDVRRRRRALSPEEFAALLSAAQAGPVVRGLSGPDRARLYLLAARSGFREAELASIHPESFDVKGGYIHLPASISKRRRAEKQPIGRDIIDALKPLIDATKPGQPLWPGTWHHRGAEMLRVDLAAAGIPYQTGEGVYDVHSLRHQYISDLIASGVTPKEAQVLARHSDINLTLSRYTHSQQEALRQAVEKLGK